MKYLIPICLLFCFNTLKSQSLWVKGYAGMGLETRIHLAFRSTDPNAIIIYPFVQVSAYLAIPSIASNIGKNDFYEIGFYIKNFRRNDISGNVKVPSTRKIEPVNLGDIEYHGFGIQADFNHQFSKNTKRRLKGFAGFSLRPTWSKFDYKSKQTYISSTNAAAFSTDFGLLFRGQYYLTKKLSLDFNGNLLLFSLIHQRSHRVKMNFKTDTEKLYERPFSGIIFRIGLSYKIK